MTKRAILYARVSTDEQSNNNVSLDDQIEKCEAYTLIHDMKVVGTFVDDYTGTKIDRPEFSTARQMLREGKADALVVYDSDRLTREPTDYIILRDEFLKLKVELHYSKRGKIDLEDFGAQLVEDFHGRFNQQWLRKLVETMQNGKTQKVKQGSVMVGREPIYGYQRVSEGKLWQLVIDGEQAKIVRLIFTWYVYGENGEPLSTTGIAKKLNELRIKPPVRKGKGSKAQWWVRQAVNRILSSETYVGVWHYRKGKKGHLTVKVPAIISRELWEEAQKRKEQNRRGATKKYDFEALLRHRCTCGDCKYQMVVQSSVKGSKVYLYYICPCYTDTALIRQCKTRTRIKAKVLDDEVWLRVKRLLSDRDYFDKVVSEKFENAEQKNASLKSQIEIVEDSITERTREFNETAQAYIKAKGMLRAVLQKQADELEETVAELRDRKAQLEKKIQEEINSRQQIKSLQAWVQKLDRGIDASDHNFETKLKIINILDVKVIVEIENGKPKITATCDLGELPAPCHDFAEDCFCGHRSSFHLRPMFYLD